MTLSASGTGWFKSSHSDAAATCIEVRFAGDVVEIRDTKANGVDGQPTLTVDAPSWRAFIAKIAG
ncbi:DUF397 domain-containing protein [Fodinicola acaciae]|uniref:DUF397 domain-containing protein n=1 Tax=Fodinicola acaciae TaxID=2681555 RepID=UPI0013CF5F47